MVLTDEEARKLHRIYKTVLQMLRDRNYNVSEDEANMSKQEFHSRLGEQMKRENLVFKKEHKDNPKEEIYVFFCDQTKIGVNIVRSFLNRMYTENVFRAILVCQTQLSPYARNAISEMQSTYRIEIFEESELLVNITKHEVVPEHQVLTNAEKNALLKRYTVKDNQLPRILHSDAIARYYGLKRGQVVRIIRPSETAGRYVTYRIVE